MGSGSIGTVLGALLTAGGAQVDLIDTFLPHVEALRTKGARITGGLDMTVSVSALSPAELSGSYDLVFLLCKQTGIEDALAALKPHLRADSTVCALENGIPEERVAAIVGRERTIGGIVLFGATWEAPGIVRCTSGGSHMKESALIEIGELDGKVTPRLLEVQRYLSRAGKIEITQSLLETRWTKILINATASGMSAALGCDYGGVLDREDAMLALAYIGDETVKVANAKGLRLTTVFGSDFQEREIRPGETVRDKLTFYHELWEEKHRALKASMLQDLEKRRPCEIDFINGAVSSGGRETGVPTPFNDLVVAIVKLEERYGFVAQPEDTLPLFSAALACRKAQNGR